MVFEKFTDRARKVFQLARQEAHRLNHEYIGTEHILLGLIKEGSGVAANVLKNLGVNIESARFELHKLIVAGPDMIIMGRVPQTPRTKKVIDNAIKEARELNHNYVGTEHILLGLLQEPEGIATQVLLNLGVNFQTAREETLNLLGHKAMETKIKIGDVVFLKSGSQAMTVNNETKGNTFSEGMVESMFHCLWFEDGKYLREGYFKGNSLSLKDTNVCTNTAV